MDGGGLKAIFNRLEDLEKIVGGAGEMFWRGARKELALLADKDANLSTQALADIKTEVEAFIHEAQTFLRLQGMDVKPIAPAIANPRDHVDVCIDLICAEKRIPRTVLMGNEHGELASSLNEEAWARGCDVRRRKHNEYDLLRPLADRLIWLGVQPAPDGGEYEIQWPDLLATKDSDKAKTGQALSAALDSYSKARKNGLAMPLEVYLREILLWDQKRMEAAEAIAGKFSELEQKAAEEAEARRQETAQKLSKAAKGDGEDGEPEPAITGSKNGNSNGGGR